MLERVLIATDGSDNAQRAVKLGSGIAHCFGAEVLLAYVQVEQPSQQEIGGLVNVWESVGPQPFGALHMDELIQRVARTPGREYVGTQAQALHEIASHLLDKAREKARKAGAEHPDSRLLHGDPAHALLELAASEEVGLIVMGSRGMGRVKGALLGSVSQKVSTHAQASCLTVR